MLPFISLLPGIISWSNSGTMLVIDVHPIQRLDCYSTPADWHPGRSFFIQGLWFSFFAPLLSSRWISGSKWRVILLRFFGAQIGHGTRIKPGFRVKYPWRLIVGQFCWLGEDAWIDNLAAVRLGDRVCLSQGAYLCTGNHNYRSSDFGLHLMQGLPHLYYGHSSGSSLCE